jgi:hypothetical protein
MNIGINHLTFEFARQHIWATFEDYMGGFSYVTRLVFKKIVASMKRQYVEVGN